MAVKKKASTHRTHKAVAPKSGSKRTHKVAAVKAAKVGSKRTHAPILGPKKHTNKRMK